MQLAYAGALGLTLTACAGPQHIRQGDRHLAAGQYGAALRSYELALDLSPQDAIARERIKKARRLAVRAELLRADEALTRREYASALRVAAKARTMPLDLDDVELVRRIDDTIREAARFAENQVRELMAEEHFVAAAALIHDISEATPGSMSRRRWAEEVANKAAAYYARLAGELEGKGFFGSAAVQLAMAKHVGAQVSTSQVVALWERFAQPTCFAQPEVRVEDRTGAAAKLAEALAQSAKERLRELRERCGQGQRQLRVQIWIDEASVVNDEQKIEAAKPLPGVSVQTEEEYFIEEPYTEVEEVTKLETRLEKQERRDCAPRPGQKRGCRTWVTEVEVRVPITTRKEVHKVRRIAKTRPIPPAELPADKILRYDLTSVRRRVSCQGRVRVSGGAAAEVLARPFEVMRESVDTAHDAVQHNRMPLPRDPLEVLPLATLMTQAIEALSGEIGQAVAHAVTSWSEGLAKQARDQVSAGLMPEAEESYLKRLALGAQGDRELRGFFLRRYGTSVVEVMGVLAAGLGRHPRPSDGESVTEGAARLPTRTAVQSSPFDGDAEAEMDPAVDPAQAYGGQAGSDRAPSASPSPHQESPVGPVADEELEALERASYTTARANSDTEDSSGVAEAPAEDAAAELQDGDSAADNAKTPEAFKDQAVPEEPSGEQESSDRGPAAPNP